MAWDPRALIYGESWYKKNSTPNVSKPTSSSTTSVNKPSSTNIPAGYVPIRQTAEAYAPVGWDSAKGVSIGGQYLPKDSYVIRNGVSYAPASLIRQYMPAATATPTQQTATTAPAQQPATNIPTQQPINISSLQDIISRLGSGYSYTPPSEEELLRQAKQYADLQTSPLLSAIQTRLANAQNIYNNQRAAVEAAYSTLPQQTERYLKMAEQQALERAIRMGGGRGGEVNWFTQKMQEPVITEAQQKEAEKSAQLAAIANALAEAQATGERERQETIARQGTLEAARLAELRDAIRQAQLQQQGIDRETLLNLLPQLMYG